MLPPRNPYRYDYLFIDPPTTNTKETTPVEPKKYVVGKPTYLTTYDSYSAAQTEATRLAKNAPGVEYTVYETKSSYKVEDKPVTVTTFV